MWLARPNNTSIEHQTTRREEMSVQERCHCAVSLTAEESMRPVLLPRGSPCLPLDSQTGLADVSWTWLWEVVHRLNCSRRRHHGYVDTTESPQVSIGTCSCYEKEELRSSWDLNLDPLNASQMLLPLNYRQLQTEHGIHELLKTSTHATWELSCVYELAHGFIISSPGWKNWNNGLQFFSRDCSESAPGPGRWPTTLQSQTGFLSVRIFYNVQCVIAGTYIQV